MDQNKLKIKYTGSNTVDLRSLAKSLQATQEIIDFICVSEYGERVKVEVSPFKKGSFEYVIKFIVENLALGDVVATMSSNGDTAKEVFDLMKWFFKAKEERVRDVKNLSTTGNDSPIDNRTVNVTNNYYGEDAIKQALAANPNSESIKKLSENPDILDPQIERFSQSIIDAGEKEYRVSSLNEEDELLHLSKENLSMMATPFSKNEVEEEDTSSIKVKLTVRQPDLATKSKWVFYDEDKVQIKAKIEDKLFNDLLLKKKIPIFPEMEFFVLLNMQTVKVQGKIPKTKYSVSRVFQIDGNALEFYDDQVSMILQSSASDNQSQSYIH